MEHQWVFYKLQRNMILGLLFNSQAHELFRCVRCNALWCETDHEYIFKDSTDNCIVKS